MDDFIIQDTEPILKIDSLGIGINTYSDIEKLSLSDKEYLVVGDRHGTPNYSNQYDTRWNMYVNHEGVAINTSRNVSSNYRDPNASLYINRNIQCDGMINAHGIQFSNISISGEIGSNTIVDLITNINILSQSQPLRTGIATYFNTIYGMQYPVQNIYTPNYLTLGGLVDTSYNQHPLNINSTPNNDFNNIHLAIRNDTYNDDTKELSKFSIGIIGGSNKSPAVISTTKGMALEFHVNKSSAEMNSLYNRNAIPTYLNDAQQAAMTIDENGNVCIGKSKAASVMYYKNVLNSGVSSNIVFTKQTAFDVKGASKFDDIIIFDNYANTYKHIDDVYIRADGVGIIRPSQITEGIFYGSNYVFNNISLNNQLTTKYINATDMLNATNINADNILINNSATFNGNVSFQNTNRLSMNSLNVENDLLIGGLRVSPINIKDTALGYTTISSSENGSNYFFTYVHSNIANLDANQNVSFPNKMSLGPNTSDGIAGVLNIYKNSSSNNNFEIVLQERVNTNKYVANIGRLSHLDFYDNSLIINTNNIDSKKHNIYFYPSYDISKLQNNAYFPNLNNTPPMLSITNEGVGINNKIPRQDLHLDIDGKMSATEYYVSKDDAIAKMSGFVYNNKNYFNIYNENTFKYCINYDNINSYSAKMQGLNVKYGINSDQYYQNDKLIETLQVTNNPNSFYTNKFISIGWSGEDVHLPLQIRNTNVAEYNYSVIRIYRGVRGGGINNNADFSGIDICEYDRDLNDDRDLEKWFIYKNHKFNDVDSRDIPRIGPLQFGYTNKTIEPTSYGMSMYYNSLNSNYHIDFNNPNVSYDFADEKSNIAVSIYGDLDVYGNINIIDNNSNNFNFRLKKLEDVAEFAKYIEVKTASNVIYKNLIEHDDIEHSGQNIIFKPIKSIIVDSIVNDSIPFVIKQNNDALSAAKFITYSSNLLCSSALELGIYRYNNFTTGYDADSNNIKNMVQFRVANKNTSNTCLTLSYYKNDSNNSFYHPFLEFNNNFTKTYMRLGQGDNKYNSNISLHIDDDNKCGIQITNIDNPVKINLVNVAGDNNKYNILSSGGNENNYKFTIDIADIPSTKLEPDTSDIVNIFTIAPYTANNNIRDGVRYGFNDPVPNQTISINSEYDEQTMKLTSRYTKDYIYTKIAINTSNLQLTAPRITNDWDNNSKVYGAAFNYSIANINTPQSDIYGNAIEGGNNNTIVSKILNTKKEVSYLSIHSNINLTFRFNESNANITNNNYNSITYNNNVVANPKYKVAFNNNVANGGTGYLFNIYPELSDTSNKIIGLDDTQFISKETSNVFNLTLDNSVVSSHYEMSCIFNNIYMVPSYFANITTSNTQITSNYTRVVNSNIITLTNEIYSYLPNINSINYNRFKLFENTNVIKLDDIGAMSNVYLRAITSNIVRYNFAPTYEGKFALFRTNYLIIDSSNIVPNTLSNSNYIINYSSNIVYANNNATYNNISNIVAIRTSNELIDGAYNTSLVAVNSNIQIDDEFTIYGATLSNTIFMEEYYRKYVNNCNINIQRTNYNRVNLKPQIILANSVRDDFIDRNSLINEIYSYDGNLKFNFRDNLFEHPQLLIDKTGNVKFFGSISTSNDLYISGNIFNVGGSNIIEDLDRKISSLETKNNDLIYATCNILIAKADLNDLNASNYVLATSNILVSKADFNDLNASNYVLATSNILVLRAGVNDFNASNYVRATSNILVVKADVNDMNVSNYVRSTSNILVAKADFNDLNASNYVRATSNILVAKADVNDFNASNYVRATSNILVLRAGVNDFNVSNYVLNTSNVISRRITGLTTDMIYEDINAKNKFIVNNTYNNNMLVNGDLTISSNLIVHGASTTLATEVYTTERLEINNENNTTSAFVIAQKDLINDIMRASNRDNNVFTIKNNGDVSIRGNFIRSNRDVITDTSNYVLATSNILSKKIDDNVAVINSTIQRNDNNTSNYVAKTNENLSIAIGNISTPWTETTSNIFIFNNVSIGTSSNIDTLTIDGGIIASRGIVSSFSDNRLKNHTSNIANPIDLINKLNGFHYTPNDMALQYGFPSVPDVGLSAQEVQSVLPEIVRIAPFDMMLDSYNNIISKSGDNYLTICYEKLAPLFVESIKALKKELDDVKRELAELKNAKK
jgi:hypothetical protein